VRVTNNMRQEQALRDLQAKLAEQAKVQDQLATGKRFPRPSEDPVAAGRSLRADRSLRGIQQYRRNIASVRARVDAEESVLDQITEMLTRAKELGISESTGTSTATTRAGAVTELDAIITQVIQLGNTKVGDEYLFGGHQTTTSPFLSDGTYMGDDGVRQAELTRDYVVTANHTGRELLVNSGVLTNLMNLRDQIRAGDQAGTAQATDAVSAGFENVQVLLADTGARSRQIDVAGQNLDASESSITVAQELDQGVTLEEATTRLLSVQTSLQAALLSTTRVMNLSLTEYLR
jgi:flagellar hook-associated protein 3 FlgL